MNIDSRRWTVQARPTKLILYVAYVVRNFSRGFERLRRIRYETCFTRHASSKQPRRTHRHFHSYYLHNCGTMKYFFFLTTSPCAWAYSELLWDATCPSQLSAFARATCTSPPNPYMVLPSPGNGLGVFATQTLDIGAVIIRESPVIRIDRPAYLKGSGYPIHEVTQV